MKDDAEDDFKTKLEKIKEARKKKFSHLPKIAKKLFWMTVVPGVAFLVLAVMAVMALIAGN